MNALSYDGPTIKTYFTVLFKDINLRFRPTIRIVFQVVVVDCTNVSRDNGVKFVDKVIVVVVCSTAAEHLEKLPEDVGAESRSRLWSHPEP